MEIPAQLYYFLAVKELTGGKLNLSLVCVSVHVLHVVFPSEHIFLLSQIRGPMVSPLGSAKITII